MNRLIILGNGFDLSHGLKTSFTDFLKHLVKERIDNPDHENEKLFSILNKSTFGGKPTLTSDGIDFNSPFDVFWGEMIKRIWDSLELSPGRFQTIHFQGRYHGTTGAQDVIFYRNNFLMSILTASNVYDWVDFEKTYYLRLTTTYKTLKNDHTALKSTVKLLNAEFEEIRKEFLKYLDLSIDVNLAKPISGYSKLLNSKKILPNSYAKSRKGVSQILVLSFNYTNVLSLYSMEPSSSEVIHIHGELNNESNPPIFGYGDEMDESYPLIESLDDNLFLEHFKSFQYGKTKNLSKLESFLRYEEFETEVIGHSCGLSDRVLLNYVFEHENCKSIKIYHHGGLEGHVNTYMNISRHFSRENKAMQRLKVVGFDPENACPQSK